MSRWKRFVAFVSADPPPLGFVNLSGCRDLRGPRELGAARALEQERQDQQLERIWRERVERNVAERMTGRRRPVVIPLFKPRVVRDGGTQ